MTTRKTVYEQKVNSYLQKKEQLLILEDLCKYRKVRIQNTLQETQELITCLNICGQFGGAIDNASLIHLKRATLERHDVYSVDSKVR
ncbi:hypothetical protein CEXT_144071 [Caerostris extrusa]|uniref:Uncharacterized protein n=1 Tax=Caerostris extrusa TaxID=172846 RepID=A0AAV4NX09_CAEEX|nr:hypothetical protein CEXT_144071 [Caerostris extrusa]